MTSADLMRTLELRWAGEDVLHRYQRHVDAKDLDALAELVTDDVVLQRRGEEWTGREAFLELYRRFSSSDVDTAQHMASNVQVDELPAGGVDDARLRVDSCFLAVTLHRSGEARWMWGRYSDDVVLRDGQWLLAAKRIELVRTAVVEEHALVSPETDSFAPRESRSSIPPQEIV